LRSSTPAPGSTTTFSTRPRFSADPGPTPHPRAAQHRRMSTDG
jgi:hypothetical protein